LPTRMVCLAGRSWYKRAHLRPSVEAGGELFLVTRTVLPALALWQAEAAVSVTHNAIKNCLSTTVHRAVEATSMAEALLSVLAAAVAETEAATPLSITAIRPRVWYTTIPSSDPRTTATFHLLLLSRTAVGVVVAGVDEEVAVGEEVMAMR